METLESIEVQRARCKECRDLLRSLAKVHTAIDVPTRRVQADEPDLVFRLRKVCLHAVAITACAIDGDGLHAMATELRAAYDQMDVVWKLLPDEFRFEQDGPWWASEARHGLARYDHPTMVSLAFPLSSGGFDDAAAPVSYLRFASWLGRLAVGYGRALEYLARVLGTYKDVEFCLDTVWRTITASNLLVSPP